MALKGNWEALDSHRAPGGVDVCKERALPLYEGYPYPVPFGSMSPRTTGKGAGLVRGTPSPGTPMPYWASFALVDQDYPPDIQAAARAFLARSGVPRADLSWNSGGLARSRADFHVVKRRCHDLILVSRLPSPLSGRFLQPRDGRPFHLAPRHLHPWA